MPLKTCKTISPLLPVVTLPTWSVICVHTLMFLKQMNSKVKFTPFSKKILNEFLQTSIFIQVLRNFPSRTPIKAAFVKKSSPSPKINLQPPNTIYKSQIYLKIKKVIKCIFHGSASLTWVHILKYHITNAKSATTVIITPPIPKPYASFLRLAASSSFSSLDRVCIRTLSGSRMRFRLVR